MKNRLLLFLLAAITVYAVEPVLKEDFDGTLSFGKLLNGKVQYIDGVNGKAAVLADAVISLPGTEKLRFEEGSATLWIKPMNYDWDKKEFLFYLTVGKSVKLYKYHIPLGLLVSYGKPGKAAVDNVYANANWSEFPNRTWMALGIVWSQKQHLLSLYINGELVASAGIKDQMFPEEAMSTWELNGPPFAPRDRKNATAYDCLRFYDKALTADDIALIYNSERPRVEVSIPLKNLRKVFVNLPRLPVSPAVNGTYDDREWAGAVKFPAMFRSGTRNVDLPWYGEVYMGHDTKKIYLCSIFKLPGGTEITAVQTKRDSEVYADDATEWLMKTDKQKLAEYYHGIFNSRCAIFDRRNNDPSWNGNWEVGANVYEGYLVTEAAITFEELERDYQEGMEWWFNVARDRIVNRDILFSSVGFHDTSTLTTEFSKIRFVDDDIFGRLSLDFNKLENRSLSATLNVVNHSATTHKINCKYELLSSPEMTPIEEKTLTCELAPNSSKELVYENPLEGRSSALLRVTAYEDGKTDAPFYVMDLPMAFKEEMRVIDNTNLVKETLSVTVDYSSNSKTRKTARIQAVFDKQNVTLTGKPVAKGAFSLKDLPAGDYVVKMDFLDEAGNVIYKHNFIYNHIGRPRWLTKHWGENAGVLWPYTPIQTQKNEFSVWGRSHTLGKQLLPKQIVSQNQKLFAAPPQLFVTINGKEKAVSNFKFTEKKKADDTVVYDFTAQEGGLEFKGTLQVEYDGLAWYDFSMISAKGTVTVDNLRLLLKFAPGIAESFNAHFFAREKEAGNLLPPLTLKRYPCLWVGNMDVGFTFMLESFKSWRHQERKQVFDFTDGDKNTRLLNIRIIDKATAIDKEFHFAFGIQANPAKAEVSWKRSWKLGSMRPHNIMHPWAFDKANTKKYSGAGGFYTPVFKSREIFLKLLENERKIGSKFSLYLNPFLVSNEATEFKIFQKEWNNPYNCYPECPNSTFTDYIMDCVKTLVDDGLEVVYVDSLGAVNCFNPEHGCGYVDEETGENELTWPILGMRNYMKRLYAMVHSPDSNPRERFLWGHTSARNCVAFNAFLDASCGGEEVEHIVVSQPHYAKIYPLDEWQVYYSNTLAGTAMPSANFGRIGPIEDRYNKAYNDEFIMIIFLHDNQIWNGWLDEVYVSSVYKLLWDWGIENEQLTFHDYRRQKLVTCAEKNVYVSVYRHPDGRSLAVVCNFNENPCTVAVKLDETALGLKNKNFELRELRSGKKVNASSLELKGYNFVLIDIRSKR